MPEIPISQLPPAGSVGSTDYVPLDQNGTTKRATVAQIGAAAQSLTQSFVTVGGESGTLPNSRSLGATQGITRTDSGAGGALTLSLTGQALNFFLLSTTGLTALTGGGNVTTRSLTGPGKGFTISNADGVAGNPTFALTGGLLALEDLTGPGVVCSTGPDTYSPRTLTGTANQITVTEGQGAGGDPTFAIADDPRLPGTSGFLPPGGTTAQRPLSPPVGTTRRNTDLNVIETWDGAQWVSQGVAGVTSVGAEGQSGITVTGSPITSSGTLTISLDDTAVAPGVFGSASAVPVLTVDQQGRITDATTAAITPDGIGCGTIATQDADSVTITGGAIDGTTIGATTAAAGKFTTLGATGDVALNSQGTLILHPGDPTQGPGGGAYDGGIIAQQVSGDGQVCAHQVQPTSGTLPPWGPITEYVVYRRGGSAVNFNRISLTGMGDYAGPALNDPAADFRLQQEASGTVPAVPIRFASQVNDTGSLIFHQTLWPDGSVQFFERTDSPAATGNNLEVVLKTDKRGLSNVLTSAGTQDSPGLRQTGAAYDTTLHRADWRSRVVPTSNAGASKWVMATRIDNASYNDVLSITDAGVLNAISGLQVNEVDVATVSGTQTLTNKTLTSPVVSGGTVDNAAIGGTTPAAATVTTLTATGQVSLGGAAGSESLRAVVVSGATNRIEVNGANGGTPYFITAGASTNIPLNFITKGSGQIGFVTGSAVQQFAVLHTAGANAAITVTGSNGGDPTLSTTSGRVSFGAVPAIPSYTVATLPTATSRGLIYVSDGASNKRLAVADGANWRWPDGAIVS